MGFFQQIFNDTHRPAPAAPELPPIFSPPVEAPVAPSVDAVPSPAEKPTPPSRQTSAVPAPAPSPIQPDPISEAREPTSPPPPGDSLSLEATAPARSHRIDHPPEATPQAAHENAMSARQLVSSRPSGAHTPLPAASASPRPKFSLQNQPPPPKNSPPANELPGIPKNKDYAATPATPGNLRPKSQEPTGDIFPRSESPAPAERPADLAAKPLNASSPRQHEALRQTPPKADARSPLRPPQAPHSPPPPSHQTPPAAARPPQAKPPSVRIGRIDIVIQSPPTPARHKPVSTPSNANAWFLRSL